ncbi:endo alpha-1,4 polygalactosaminidase [Phytohabitans houttuyneae]|uniref:Glycoside-hydrolase family GH114 TIM-barrel domain-containing protein n=1 Tax=Phytohabitans houttuyneae TaxID=1076126 RepID=A0A6V8KGP2_9ACTN|nr:endo alpha-1,4 polygalactosaminidase [Phytohabitans houttuyneae]GFJ81568.1 hypothetical protein Phou_057480 [Phytohabitans houttuyneae]
MSDGWLRRLGGLTLICGLLGACADQSPAPAGTPADSRVALPATNQAWRPPPANAVFDYQIGGPYPPAEEVGVLVRDRAAPPVSGRYTICYVNAFQTQPDDNSWWQSHHDSLLLKDRGGRYVEDPDWPGEHLLDISTPERRTELAAIVGGWFADCAAHGFDAVEPDNLDSWTRSDSLLSQADAVAFARQLVEAAHTRGLAVGQKNTPDLSQTGRDDIGFDFALAEECAVYEECDLYQAAYGNQVYEIEYTDNGTDAYRRACADRGAQISIILRDRDVVPAGASGYHHEHC